jgi:hypothetical protein
MTEIRNAHNILVGKPEEKMPFWRPMHRWRENIKQDLKENVCARMGWLYEASGHAIMIHNKV